MKYVLKRRSLSIRVLLRTWTVSRLSGSVRDERVLWTRGFLSNGIMRVKPGRWAFTYDPEIYVREVDSVLTSLSPLWEIRGCSFN
jgi:hypothetical protein